MKQIIYSSPAGLSLADNLVILFVANVIMTVTRILVFTGQLSRGGVGAVGCCRFCCFFVCFTFVVVVVVLFF